MTDKIAAELAQIKGKKNLLLAEDVVAWAEAHPDSECHQEFEWDDEKASHEFRLIQARQLIKLHVIPDSSVPVYVSLSVDRVEESGGYRDREQVKRSPKLRSILVQDALKEFVRLRNRYADLKELDDIFQVIDAFSEKEVAVA